MTRIHLEIESYFADLKHLAVAELRAKFQTDPDAYEEFFQWDGGSLRNGQWNYRDEMDDALDIPTSQNTSDVNALKTIIESRDSCLFLPKDAPVPEPDHWPEGRTHELFAVLALRLLASCIVWTKALHGATNLSIAGACALEAMDAVCFAEQAREVEWLNQFHQKQLREATSSHGARLTEIKEKVRSDFIAEQIEYEQAKQTTRSERMNAARHKSTKDARELVCKDWGKAISDFPSAEKAGIHYADWLEKKSIGYQLKGKQAFYQPRAVTTWIRQYAKEKSIKFR